MEPPRFYCPQLDLGVLTLPESESRHALQSLRLRPGADVALFDGQGGVAHGILLANEPAEGPRRPARSGKQAPVASIQVTELVSVPPPARTLTLIVAGCKGARLEWLVEKCTELGTDRIVLAEFERSVVHAGPRHVNKLRRTSIEACKQCGRAWLPEINAGVSLEDAVTKSEPGALLIADPDPQATPLVDWPSRSGAEMGNVTAVIGPEGGLSVPEREYLQSVGGKLVCLAPHVLRVETAAISVAATWASLQLLQE